MAKIVPYGVSHVVACHTMWLFVLRGLLIVWKVVMKLFGRFQVLLAGTELVRNSYLYWLWHILAHLGSCSNYVEDATSV